MHSQSSPLGNPGDALWHRHVQTHSFVCFAKCSSVTHSLFGANGKEYRIELMVTEYLIELIVTETLNG
jgi:hypothetical protein